MCVPVLYVEDVVYVIFFWAGAMRLSTASSLLVKLICLNVCGTESSFPRGEQAVFNDWFCLILLSLHLSCSCRKVSQGTKTKGGKIVGIHESILAFWLFLSIPVHSVPYELKREDLRCIHMMETYILTLHTTLLWVTFKSPLLMCSFTAGGMKLSLLKPFKGDNSYADLTEIAGSF